MSTIDIRFDTGNVESNWSRMQSHVPVIGAIVKEPDGRKKYRVKGHVWPSRILDNYVTMLMIEIIGDVDEFYEE